MANETVTIKKLYMVVEEPLFKWRQAMTVSIWHTHATNSADAVRIYDRLCGRGDRRYFKAPKAYVVSAGGEPLRT